MQGSGSEAGTTNTAQCYFLGKRFSAELRNTIYQLVSLPEHAEQDEDGMIHLWTVRGPNPNFLLTCRQIHDEAHGLFKHATQRFWQKTEFWLHNVNVADLLGYRPHASFRSYYEPTRDENTILQWFYIMMDGTGAFSNRPHADRPTCYPRWGLMEHFTVKGFQDKDKIWTYDHGIWADRRMTANAIGFFCVSMTEVDYWYDGSRKILTRRIYKGEIQLEREASKRSRKIHIVTQLRALVQDNWLLFDGRTKPWS